MSRVGAGLVSLMVALLFGSGSSAQTEARQATPDEVAKAARGPAALADQEVPNPMLLEVTLPGHASPRGILDLEPGSQETWVTNSTSRFVCDRARVTQVKVRRGWGSRKKAILEITPSISSGWYRQDIDLTLELVASDGLVIKRRFWDDMTIGSDSGPYSGYTKSPIFTVSMPMQQFEGYFGSAEPPTLKILVAVQTEQHERLTGAEREIARADREHFQRPHCATSDLRHAENSARGDNRGLASAVRCGRK